MYQPTPSDKAKLAKATQKNVQGSDIRYVNKASASFQDSVVYISFYISSQH